MASDPISKPDSGSKPEPKSKKLVSRRGKLSLVTEQQTPESPAEPEPGTTLCPELSSDGHVPALSADLSADTLPPDTSRALATLVHEYNRLGARIADLKASQDALKSEIESICFEIPAKRISGSDWHTTRSRKPTTFIDKNRLAEKGVDPAIISHATVTKWSKEFVLPVVEKEQAPK